MLNHVRAVLLIAADEVVICLGAAPALEDADDGALPTAFGTGTAPEKNLIQIFLGR